MKLFWYENDVVLHTNDKESVDVDAGVRSSLHLLEYCQSWIMVRPQLQHMPEVQSGLLEVPVGFQNFTQLKKYFS